MDIPCLLFIDEMLAQYPNAKVILTNRDVESWNRSMRDTFFIVFNWRTFPLIAALDPVSLHRTKVLLVAHAEKDAAALGTSLLHAPGDH